MGIQINGQTDTVTATDGSLNVGGDVTIPGVLTYDDITNIDSVGVITARSGLHVTGGSVGIGTDNPGLTAHIYSTAATDVALIESTQNFATLRFKSALNSSGPTIGIDGAGGLQLDQKDTSKYISFAIGSERLRILSDGTIGIGSITSTTPVTPPTDVLDGNVPELSPVLKIHRNNAHVSAGTSIGLLISDRVNRGTDAFNPLVLETAHNGTSDYSGSMIKGRRYNHGGYDGTGFEINIGNGDGVCTIVAGAHYNPADQKYSFDGQRGAAMIKLSDTSTQGVVRLFGSEGYGDPGIGVTMLQHYPPPTFYAHQTVTQTLTSGTDTKVTYTSETFDTHSAYNTSTSTFTAPMSGYYLMHATLRIQTAGNDMRYDISFYKNGSASIYSGGLNQQTINDASTMATVIMDLNKGDTVEVYADQNGGSSETSSITSNAGGTGMSHFTGYLVAPKFA